MTPHRPSMSSTAARALMRLPALGLALVLGACATAYQPDSWTGGFEEAQLVENVFRVQFRGNGMTSSTRAEEMALLRSAELTLLKGYTHFAIVDDRHSEDVATLASPAQSFTTVSGGGLQTTTYGGGLTFISRPRSRNTVMMFRGAPAQGGVVFDARIVCNSLGRKYDVACGA